LSLFGPEERLELLDGEILQKMTQGGPHAAVTSRVSRLLAAAFGAGYHIRAHSPLVLTDHSEPEADVVVVPGREFDYMPDHPRATDARLIVEVSDTTLRFDRGRKRAAYARAGIPEY
jgi:Uma2 family endonuclease